jgi:hypothetical protein
MTNWSEEIPHDGSAECPVPEGVRISFRQDDGKPEMLANCPKGYIWDVIVAYRYDMDQMRKHLMENKVPFGLLLPAEQHWFRQQTVAQFWSFGPRGWLGTAPSFSKDIVYRPTPEPKTFERFVNVSADRAANWYSLEAAEKLRESDGAIRTYHDTYNAETGERISSECIWEKDDERG